MRSSGQVTLATRAHYHLSGAGGRSWARRLLSTSETPGQHVYRGAWLVTNRSQRAQLFPSGTGLLPFTCRGAGPQWASSPPLLGGHGLCKARGRALVLSRQLPASGWSPMGSPGLVISGSQLGHGVNGGGGTHRRKSEGSTHMYRPRRCCLQKLHVCAGPGRSMVVNTWERERGGRRAREGDSGKYTVTETHGDRERERQKESGRRMNGDGQNTATERKEAEMARKKRRKKADTKRRTQDSPRGCAPGQTRPPSGQLWAGRGEV